MEADLMGNSFCGVVVSVFYIQVNDYLKSNRKGGIRTLGGIFSLGSLANFYLKPLGHLSMLS